MHVNPFTSTDVKHSIIRKKTADDHSMISRFSRIIDRTIAFMKLKVLLFFFSSYLFIYLFSDELNTHVQ